MEESRFEMSHTPIAPPSSPWDEWPKWDSDQEFCTKRFQFIGSVNQFDKKTQGDRIAILKHRQFIEIYKELLSENPLNILELGYFQGGMPLFISDMHLPDLADNGKPLHIVGIDYYEPTKELKATIESNKLADTIKLYGGILQDNVKAIKTVVESEFGQQPLDLIIDDCSHQYQETKLCFESFFSHLKPDGKYVIEDWGWQHWPGEPWQTSNSPFHGKPSMSNLILELVMAMGSRPDMIARIEVVSEFCTVITRGPNLAHGERVILSEITKMAGRTYVPM
jgi:SAM-dependent methyltransferase